MPKAPLTKEEYLKKYLSKPKGSKQKGDGTVHYITLVSYLFCFTRLSNGRCVVSCLFYRLCSFTSGYLNSLYSFSSFYAMLSNHA